MKSSIGPPHSNAIPTSPVPRWCPAISARVEELEPLLAILPADALLVGLRGGKGAESLAVYSQSSLELTTRVAPGGAAPPAAQAPHP